MSDPISLIPKDAFTESGRGKFKAKLDFADRCAVLALIRSGVRRPVVAAAFRLDRRTVGHISNPNGVKYREVRDEYQKLGHKEFTETYITERIAGLVAEYLSEAEKAHQPAVPSNARSRAKAGLNIVKPEQCSYSHRIEIQFFNDRDPTGWYYRDLDSNDPGAWLHNGEESLTTSQACLKMVELNLTDD